MHIERTPDFGSNWGVWGNSVTARSRLTFHFFPGRKGEEEEEEEEEGEEGCGGWWWRVWGDDIYTECCFSSCRMEPAHHHLRTAAHPLKLVTSKKSIAFRSVTGCPSLSLVAI
jgi:hypothetical protein